MTGQSTLSKPLVTSAVTRSAARPAIWSRVTSTRADGKLAPCVARPNLFSGD